MTFVINSFFDDDVQDLIRNPALDSWPEDIEEYTDQQIIERLERSSHLDDIKNYLLKTFDDTDPKKPLYLSYVEDAIESIGFIFSPYPNEINVPDSHLFEWNKEAETLASRLPHPDSQTVLKSELLDTDSAAQISENLIFIHRAIRYLKGFIHDLAQERGSAVERDKLTREYTATLEKYKNLVSAYLDQKKCIHMESKTNFKTANRPLSIQQARVETIVELLHEMGYNGMRPPKPPPGQSGVKSKVKERLLDKSPLFTISDSSFKKAWEAVPASYED